MKKPLFLALACAAALPVAQAQTGRIARLSHSGRAVPLSAGAATADNLGEPRETHYEKVTRLNDSMALVEGKHNSWNGPWQPLKWQLKYHAVKDTTTLKRAIEKLRKQYPEAKFVGFAASRKGKRIKSAEVGWHYLLPPVPPVTGGTAVLLAALAGAGWLLAGRRSKATFAA